MTAYKSRYTQWSKSMTGVMERKEIIKFGLEEIEVYPEWCARESRNCAQCHLEGKIACAPRFRKGLKLPEQVSIEALLKQGKRPLLIHKQTGTPLPTIYSVAARLRRTGIIARLHEPHTDEQKQEIVAYVREHPNEQYRDIAGIFSVEPSFVSRLSTKAGIYRRKMLQEESNRKVQQAIEILGADPDRSITSIAQSLGMAETTLGARLRKKGVLPIHHEARLVLKSIREEVRLGVVEALNLTGADYIKRSPETWWKQHPQAGFCPVCKEDCKIVGLTDIVTTWEVCSCGNPEHPHLVEQLWHRKCFSVCYTQIGGFRWGS